MATAVRQADVLQRTPAGAGGLLAVPGCPHDYGDQWMIRKPDGKLGQFGRQTRRGPQSGQ
jgi:hypothetical protein